MQDFKTWAAKRLNGFFFFFSYGFKKLTWYEKIKYKNELREEMMSFCGFRIMCKLLKYFY